MAVPPPSQPLSALRQPLALLDYDACGRAPWPRSRRSPIRSCCPTVHWPTQETRAPSSAAWATWSYSSVHLPEHDVERTEYRRHVGKQVATADEVHGLKMREARRT